MAEESTFSPSLFSDDLLYDLDFSETTSKLPDGMSPKSPGEGLCMRSLRLNDFSKGYLSLLAQLTTVGDVPQEKFEAQFRAIQGCPGTHYITVVEDMTRGEIIAAASLIVEHKFAHSASERGRIEDVVVSEQYRGRQIAKLLLETLSRLAISLGCYKISLECFESYRGFYEKFGFKDEKILFLTRRFYD